MNNLITVTLLIAALFAPGFSFAQSTGIGGGDPCRDEIDRHRIELQNWIQSDAARKIDFSKAEVKGWTWDDPGSAKRYKPAMLSVLEEGKVIVKCFLDPLRASDPITQALANRYKLSYRSIAIGKDPQPTACTNTMDKKGIWHIDCSYERIIASLGDPDYQLTHHEFASIAGVEDRKPKMVNGNYVSDFSISHQLSRFEHMKVVKVLGEEIEKKNSCLLCGSLSPSIVKRKIETIFNKSPRANLADLNTTRASVATCSDGKNIFYIPFSFGVIKKIIGETEVKTAAFFNLSDYPWLQRENSWSKTWSGAQNILTRNSSNFTYYVENPRSPLNASYNQDAYSLFLLIQGDRTQNVTLRLASEEGTYVFRWYDKEAADWEASCIF